MRALVIAEKKAQGEPFVKSLEERGIRAQYIRVSRISLVSVENKTLIKVKGKELPRFDAVFFQVRPSLAPFLEPLIEAFKSTGAFLSATESSFYSSFNEPYQFVILAMNDVPTPRTLTSGSGKSIEKISSKISYPLIAKSFLGKNVQQSIVVNTNRELGSFVNSIKSGVDGFMLREFIESDVVSCIVVGANVFAIKRKFKNQAVSSMERGSTYRPTESEKEIAIKAASACCLKIARVDIAKGKVVKVDPVLPRDAFNKISSEKIEDKVASFLIEKMEEIGPKVSIVDDIKEIKSLFSRTILGRVFK